MNKLKLSVALATHNEEENIGKCLNSVKEIADEIIMVDEYSKDKTAEIAKSLGAKVFLEPHHEIFHITKQKALDYATGDWILQLDADERVSPELADEIRDVLQMRNDELEIREQSKSKSKRYRLFMRHQKLIEERDGVIGKKTGDLPAGRQDIVAFFIPRRNYFLGKPLIHAGVYPDGVIRLVKKGKAYFPQKSVHEQIEIDGKVSWLMSDLIHDDSPTFSKYLSRLNRYTDLHARELLEKGVPKTGSFFIYYSFFKPTILFLKLYLRHKGFLDGIHGFVWSLFSAFHYPIAYFKYLTNK